MNPHIDPAAVQSLLYFILDLPAFFWTSFV